MLVVASSRRVGYVGGRNGRSPEQRIIIAAWQAVVLLQGVLYYPTFLIEIHGIFCKDKPFDRGGAFACREAHEERVLR